MSNKNCTLATIKAQVIKSFRNNNSVLDECTLINVRRIYYLAMIAIPIRIFTILSFTCTTPHDSPAVKMWAQGIITSHYLLLGFMITVLILAHKLKKSITTSTPMFILQYVVIVIIMSSGIAIVSIDQLVTTSITPFLLTCIVCGSVFLIRPLISFALYSTTYVAYYYLIALNIANQQVLLSNRVNGITAVGIGFLLSIIFWHYNYTNITQRWRIKKQQRQLEQMAYYDPLTFIPNRHYFDKVIKQELSSTQNHGHNSVIIILDIDDFKDINDTYGHPAGDNILRQLANILTDNIRETDTVSRFGGEEFVILMPKASLEEGYDFAERLRNLIYNKKFTIESVTLQITASFGVSLLHNNKSQRLEDYYSLADQALYLAKNSGKNRVKTSL